jgi:hypothetical protein
MLRHATFDTTGDLKELAFPRALLAAVVEAMGGAFVREGEARPPMPSRLSSRGPPWIFVIGQTTEPKWRVYSDEWLVDMVLKGRKLSPKTYLIVETTEEEYDGCTQPFTKRARQVCQCMASAGLTSNLLGPTAVVPTSLVAPSSCLPTGHSTANMGPGFMVPHKPCSCHCVARQGCSRHN